jgi:hypothetical protein
MLHFKRIDHRLRSKLWRITSGDIRSININSTYGVNQIDSLWFNCARHVEAEMVISFYDD